MRRYLCRIAINVFRSPKTLHEVHHLLKRARESMLTGSLAVIRPIGRNAYRIVSLSTSKGYWKRGSAGLAIAFRKGDYDAVHYAYVSPKEMKCSCLYSTRIGAKADAILESLGMPPIASKYAMCKHVLAAIAYLCGTGSLSLRDGTLRNTLVKGLAVLYLAIEDIDRVKRSADLIKRVLGSGGDGESSSP